MNKNLLTALTEVPSNTFITLLGTNVPNKALVLHKVDLEHGLVSLYESKVENRDRKQFYVFDLNYICGFAISNQAIPEDRLINLK